MNEKLLPCPFCGGEVKYVRCGCLDSNIPEEYKNWIMIICPSCLCTTEGFENIQELTTLWNKRSLNEVDKKGLKTCPHCGKKARVFMQPNGNYRVECNDKDNYNCPHTSTGFSYDKNNAITAWNRRAEVKDG